MLFQNGFLLLTIPDTFGSNKRTAVYNNAYHFRIHLFPSDNKLYIVQNSRKYRGFPQQAFFMHIPCIVCPTCYLFLTIMGLNKRFIYYHFQKFFDQLSINIPSSSAIFEKEAICRMQQEVRIYQSGLKYIHSGLNKLNYFTLKIILIIMQLLLPCALLFTLTWLWPFAIDKTISSSIRHYQNNVWYHLTLKYSIISVTTDTYVVLTGLISLAWLIGNKGWSSHSKWTYHVVPNVRGYQRIKVYLNDGLDNRTGHIALHASVKKWNNN